jgi:hypothetical protein
MNCRRIITRPSRSPVSRLGGRRFREARLDPVLLRPVTDVVGDRRLVRELDMEGRVVDDRGLRAEAEEVVPQGFGLGDDDGRRVERGGRL